ncbi:hypothetical protein BOX30_09595 [Leptospirillum ferriphilum]|uniref:Uncharacterized protein n=1 Tax=Leptospirillum ferriphilum TaxID=178606 RepID=A0A1V3SX82_9BACT|nr:hypothetical protein BOX24_05780 [Leptospirillum ferriphilum]OOH77654.1 hypothetical protein BOX30_09595 [Leptospirillum ferriphilum]
MHFAIKDDLDFLKRGSLSEAFSGFQAIGDGEDQRTVSSSQPAESVEQFLFLGKRGVLFADRPLPARGAAHDKPVQRDLMDTGQPDEKLYGRNPRSGLETGDLLLTDAQKFRESGLGHVSAKVAYAGSEAQRIPVVVDSLLVYHSYYAFLEYMKGSGKLAGL